MLGSRGSGELLKIVTLDTASTKECFPGGSDGKESACKAGDPGSIPGSGGSPGEGNGIPLQCAWLENSVNRGTWWATVHGVSKESDTTNTFTKEREKERETEREGGGGGKKQTRHSSTRTGTCLFPCRVFSVLISSQPLVHDQYLREE